ncbi:hypothetical protein HMPREF1978_01300, partial [Actinomyces graevenitzii F0530]
VYLVGGYRYQWFIGFDVLAYSLVPRRNGAFSYRFAQGGHFNGM